MMRLSRFSSTIFCSALLASCSQASFYGSAASKAKAPTVTPNTTISCAVAPATVTVGEQAVVSIVNAAADAELSETITNGDRTAVLSLALADGIYGVKDGGGTNQVTAAAAGHYTVDLRRIGSDAIVATCGFEANAEEIGAGSGSGSTSGTASEPTATNPPVIDPPVINPPVGPICKDTEHATGAHVAFLIDNSNSNSATDCLNPKQIETFQGSKVYTCDGPTNREKAVLAAFDLLQSVSDKEPSSTAASSSLAIASFPTRTDFMKGWAKETNGMVGVAAASRSTVSDALAFSRKPYGQTPYDGAMTAANDLFQGLADDGKARVAVLVTDGEPTDGNPSAVAAKADALRQQGIQVITVFYSLSADRALRRGSAMQNLADINNASIASGNGPWYDAAYANFADWSKALIGGTNQKSLAETISSDVVEVQNAEALKATFLSIIKTKIVCE